MSTDEGAASILGRGPTSMSGAATPGETLRVARQLAGLSQEDIANKLKLSPRQIAAIETGDWSALPERTFTRGFMRNYARLVGVEPDSLGLDQAPSQPNAATQLKPTPAAIGEIVHEADRNGFNAARWVVPALLIAAIAAGALYFQGQRWFGWDPSNIFATSATPTLKSVVAAKAELAEKADASTAAANAVAPATLPTSSGSVIAPSGGAIAPEIAGVPAATAADAAVIAAGTAPAASQVAQPSPALVPAPGEKRISLTFKGKSWTEVRSKGDVIFSETATPGTREFNGALPLSFIVGNASRVAVSIDGKPFDMSELTRNDVARFRVE
jgi:cytoskeleton protein RodZ